MLYKINIKKVKNSLTPFEPYVIVVVEQTRSIELSSAIY